MDFGYPQTTDSKILQEWVSISLWLELKLNGFTASRDSAMNVNSTGWWFNCIQACQKQKYMTIWQFEVHYMDIDFW